MRVSLLVKNAQRSLLEHMHMTTRSAPNISNSNQRTMGDLLQDKPQMAPQSISSKKSSLAMKSQPQADQRRLQTNPALTLLQFSKPQPTDKQKQINEQIKLLNEEINALNQEKIIKKHLVLRIHTLYKNQNDYQLMETFSDMLEQLNQEIKIIQKAIRDKYDEVYKLDQQLLEIEKEQNKKIQQLWQDSIQKKKQKQLQKKKLDIQKEGQSQFALSQSKKNEKRMEIQQSSQCIFFQINSQTCQPQIQTQNRPTISSKSQRDQKRKSSQHQKLMLQPYQRQVSKIKKTIRDTWGYIRSLMAEKKQKIKRGIDCLQEMLQRASEGHKQSVLYNAHQYMKIKNTKNSQQQIKAAQQDLHKLQNELYWLNDQLQKK